MKLGEGDENFFVGCSPHTGFSFEYVNTADMKCSGESDLCAHTVDYQGDGTKPVTLVVDSQSFAVTMYPTDAPTIPLFPAEASRENMEAKKKEMLDAIVKAKTVALSFPAVSRYVSFKDIRNQEAFTAFLQTCKENYAAAIKRQAEAAERRKQLLEKKASTKSE